MSESNGEHRGFLADLHESDLAVVLEHTQARVYAPGEFAVHRGELDRSFFVISRGSFDVLVPSDDGPKRVRVLEPGDLFGEVGFFDGLPRSADVVALEEAERSEEHTSELQSRQYLVCRLLLEKKKTQ